MSLPLLGLWLLCECYSYFRFSQRVSRYRQQSITRRATIVTWHEKHNASIPELEWHQALEQRLVPYDSGARDMFAAVYKPLPYYLSLRGAYYLGSWCANLYGWRASYDATGIRYWSKGTGTPLLFFHGFGFGVFPYMPHLEALTQRYRVIAPEYPGICYDGNTTIPNNEAFSNACVRFVGTDFLLMSNSYGSFSHAHVLRHYPTRVLAQVFAEPVCFYPYFGSLVNFVEINTATIWRQPTWRSRAMLFCSYLLVAKDINVLCLCHRALAEPHWDGEAALSAIPTLVLLSEADYIIESRRLAVYLSQKYPLVKAVVLPRIGHGEALFGAQVESISRFLLSS